jgi:hypothetical protein
MSLKDDFHSYDEALEMGRRVNFLGYSASEMSTEDLYALVGMLLDRLQYAERKSGDVVRPVKRPAEQP